MKVTIEFEIPTYGPDSDLGPEEMVGEVFYTLENQAEYFNPGDISPGAIHDIEFDGKVIGTLKVNP